MTKKYTTVIFDMDGTLLNTLEDLQSSVNHAMRSCGFPEHSLENIRKFVGNGIERLLELAVPDGKDNPKFSQAFEAFKADYAIHCNDKTKPYDGVLELMKVLKEHQIKMAIVSNKADFGVQKLLEIYFGEVVDVAIGQRENLRKKPEPDMVWEALKELGANKDEAVYIGDSEVDLATARNSGLPCISVEWGFRDRGFLEKEGAECIVGSAKELEKLLLS
jgi:phosphoglycolate phosphatase